MGMKMDCEEEVQMKDGRQATRCFEFVNSGVRGMNKIKNVLMQDLTPNIISNIISGHGLRGK